MRAPIIVDPEHWRDRAARMQALAVKMAGSLAAILMNDLASTTTIWPIKPRSRSSPRARDKMKYVVISCASVLAPGVLVALVWGFAYFERDHVSHAELAHSRMYTKISCGPAVP